jgi:hypothetical protein
MISKVDPILGFFELTFRGSKAVRDMRLCLPAAPCSWPSCRHGHELTRSPQSSKTITQI